MDLDAIKKDMKQNKLTQKKLGEIIGRDQTTVSKYLSHKRNISIEVFENICKVMNVPPYKYFIDDELKRKLVAGASILKEFLKSL